MEVWFSIQIAWKAPLKTSSSPGKLEFANGILLFQGWPGILYPSLCMYIKWSTTVNDIKTHFEITLILDTALPLRVISCLPLILSHIQDQGIIVFSLIFH